MVRRASYRPVALGAPVGFPNAVVPFPNPAGNRAHCACRSPPPWPGRLARSESYPFGAPQWGCPWRVPPASGLGCVRCNGRRVWTRSLTRPVSRTVRRWTEAWASAPGLFCVDADTSPCGSEDAGPGSRACVRLLVRPGWVERAGLLGAFWCASPSPLAALSFCFAWPPPGWDYPFLGPLFARPPPLCFFFFCCCFPRAPSVACFLWFPAQVPRALALCALLFVGARGRAGVSRALGPCPRTRKKDE